MRYDDAITARKVPAPVETKADPFTLESLIAWLEKQPPDRRYDWHNCMGGCLIGMYYAAIGVEHGTRYAKVFDGRHGGDYSRVCSSLQGPTTFGAALERARKLAA